MSIPLSIRPTTLADRNMPQQSAEHTSRYTGNSCNYDGLVKSAREGAMYTAPTGLVTGALAGFAAGGGLPGAATGAVIGGSIQGGLQHYVGCN